MSRKHNVLGVDANPSDGDAGRAAPPNRICLVILSVGTRSSTIRPRERIVFGSTHLRDVALSTRISCVRVCGAEVALE